VVFVGTGPYDMQQSVHVPYPKIEHPIRKEV
jgi:hypothetical protein